MASRLSVTCVLLCRVQDSGVGKTCIVNRFVSDVFSEHESLTVGWVLARWDYKRASCCLTNLFTDLTIVALKWGFLYKYLRRVCATNIITGQSHPLCVTYRSVCKRFQVESSNQQTFKNWSKWIPNDKDHRSTKLWQTKRRRGYNLPLNHSKSKGNNQAQMWQSDSVTEWLLVPTMLTQMWIE